MWGIAANKLKPTKIFVLSYIYFWFQISVLINNANVKQKKKKNPLMRGQVFLLFEGLFLIKFAKFMCFKNVLYIFPYVALAFFKP